MKKKREIDVKDLIDFFVSVCVSFSIDLTPAQVADVVSTIYSCFDDDMMFDSWFRGIDVMN